VWNNRAWGNCVGFVFVDTAEDPVPTTDWTAVRNVAKRNNGACTGETNGPPPLSGIGILALGTQQTTIAHNRVLNNRPTGKSVASGGIVLASAKPIGGAVPTGNLIARNTAHHNQPFDIVWDLSGTNNRFVHNHCGTSRPAWICQ
jgi:hypothetical protein